MSKVAPETKAEVNIFKDEEIDKIQTILDWYNRKSPEYNDIVKLLDSSKKLAGYSHPLALKTAAMHWNWKKAEGMYETIRSSNYLKLKAEDPDMSNSAAELEAKHKSSKGREDYLFKEGMYRYYSIILNSVYENLARMNQHIAYLRKEEEISKMRTT